MLALSDSEVHIWHAHVESCLDDKSRSRTLLNVLSESERSLREGVKIDHVRQERLLSRALVRWVLSRYADVAPEEWLFRDNRFGRPEIVPHPGVPPIRFNVSHSHGVVLAGFTLDHDIGVDIESHSRQLSVDGISKFLSLPEREQLESFDVEARAKAFLRIWTLKEAYAKAHGMGLSLPFDRFSFGLSEQPELSIHNDFDLDDSPRSWQFEQFDVAPCHIAAIAVRSNGTPLRFFMQPFKA